MSPNVSHEPSQPEFPISMSLTEFHLVLLYSDRIAAISLLNESLVHEELLPLVST
jgi:vacuolar protein sorting-associated protein 18